MSNESLNRRRFLLSLAAVAATGTVAGRAFAQGAAATKVSPDDPTAKSLAYTENASSIDPAKESMYKKGSECANCQFYQAAQAKGGYAPCTIFQGKLVHSAGWCRAYSAKG
jgi:hypothetical protein